MVIIPTQDNIIIKLPKLEKEKKTNSGIILSTNTSTQEISDEGVVVAIGTGRLLNDGTRIPPSVKEGDKIIYNKFAGTKITSEDEEYLIIKENDILAIIK